MALVLSWPWRQVQDLSTRAGATEEEPHAMEVNAAYFCGLLDTALPMPRIEFVTPVEVTDTFVAPAAESHLSIYDLCLNGVVVVSLPCANLKCRRVRSLTLLPETSSKFWRCVTNSSRCRKMESSSMWAHRRTRSRSQRLTCCFL